MKSSFFFLHPDHIRLVDYIQKLEQKNNKINDRYEEREWGSAINLQFPVQLLEGECKT